MKAGRIVEKTDHRKRGGTTTKCRSILCLYTCIFIKYSGAILDSIQSKEVDEEVEYYGTQRT